MVFPLRSISIESIKLKIRSISTYAGPIDVGLLLIHSQVSDIRIIFELLDSTAYRVIMTISPVFTTVTVIRRRRGAPASCV